MSYVAGLDVELTEGALSEVQTEEISGFLANLYVAETHYDFAVEAQVIAPYLHAVWSLSDATDVTTGLRWEMTDYDYTDNTGGGLSGKLFRPDSRSDDFSDISPKLGLVHRLADNRRVFAIGHAPRALRKSPIFIVCATAIGGMALTQMSAPLTRKR